jgi:small subunit ribosomal protein S6
LKTYEAVFVIDERKFEDAGEAFSCEVAKLIESLGGSVRERTSLGRRQFARPIKKQNAGIYWDFIFDLDPAQVKALKSAYSLNDAVFRSEVFICDRPQAIKA